MEYSLCRMKYLLSIVMVISVLVTIMLNGKMCPNETRHHIQQVTLGDFQQTLKVNMTTDFILKQGAQNFNIRGLKGTEGYLVYDCSKRWPGSCGGWSDRLSGILSTLVLSILTNRTFLINIDNPCQLEKFFEPKTYDWRYNAKILKNNSFANYYLKDDAALKMIQLLWSANSSEPIKSFFTTTVGFVRINWDLTKEFRQFRHIEKYVPWLTLLHFADIYQYIFNYLFHPKEFLIQKLTSTKNGKANNMTVCGHIRIGRSPTIPADNVRLKRSIISVLWEFFHTFDKTKHTLFLASDSNDVREEFHDKFQGYSIFEFPGSIMHIDLQKTGDICAGFHKQLLDFLFLSFSCDILVICESGFSMMAAYWRPFSANLYCLTLHSVSPCSRYTVNDFYQKPILSPESVTKLRKEFLKNNNLP